MILALDLDATVWTPELYQLWGGAPFKRCDKTGRVEDRNGERLELMGHAPAVLTMLAHAQARAAAPGGGGGRAEEGADEDAAAANGEEGADALLLSDRGWEATELAYVSRTEHGDWAADALAKFTFPLPCAPAPSSSPSPPSSSSSPPSSSSSSRRAARAAAASAHPPNLHALAAHHEIYPGSKIAHFKRLRERTGVDYGDMLFFDNEGWNVREVERLGVVSVHCPQGLTRRAWEEGVRLFAERKRLGGGDAGTAATTTTTTTTAGRRKGQR
jgi:magnesium-dependent phosphatase 1